MPSAFQLQLLHHVIFNDALFPLLLSVTAHSSDFTILACHAISIKLAAPFGAYSLRSFALSSCRNFFIDFRAFFKAFPFLRPQLIALAHWLSFLHY